MNTASKQTPSHEATQTTRSTLSYEISLKETLSNAWQQFFKGLELENRNLAGKDVSVLKGQLDEASLQSVLNQLRDLNLHVERVSTLSTAPVQTVTPQKGMSS